MSGGSGASVKRARLVNSNAIEGVMTAAAGIATGDDARLNSLRVGTVSTPAVSTGEVRASHVSVGDGTGKGLHLVQESSGPVLYAGGSGYLRFNLNVTGSLGASSTAVSFYDPVNVVTRAALTNDSQLFLRPNANSESYNLSPGYLYFSTGTNSLRISNGDAYYQPLGMATTWYPSMLAGATDVTAAAQVIGQTCRNGRIVTCSLKVTWTGTPTGGGFDGRTFSVVGLPWGLPAQGGSFSCFTDGVKITGSSGNVWPLQCFIRGGQANVFFGMITNNGTYTATLMSAFKIGAWFEVTFTYNCDGADPDAVQYT